MRSRIRHLIPSTVTAIALTISTACAESALPVVGAAATPSPSADSTVPEKAAANETAIFAGGCFWCMEAEFEHRPGVLSTESGYTGGSLASPSYEQVSSGTTGHFESIRVTYDPQRVSYEQLLAIYWSNVDPLSDDGQFCDRGTQYRAAIFVKNDKERALAEASRQKVAAELKDQGKVVTRILNASTFYPAEDYHQNYSDKNPERYKRYKEGCGRPRRLEAIWGKK